MGVDSQEAEKRWRSGDKAAEAAFLQLGKNLGVGVANIINVFDPEAIILSGGLSQVAGLIWPGIKEGVEKAMSLFNSPVIKQALSQIQGSEIALSMVKMPLGKSADPILKQKIKRKLKNGKKRSGKKRKAQMHKV